MNMHCGRQGMDEAQVRRATARERPRAIDALMLDALAEPSWAACEIQFWTAGLLILCGRQQAFASQRSRATACERQRTDELHTIAVLAEPSHARNEIHSGPAGLSFLCGRHAVLEARDLDATVCERPAIVDIRKAYALAGPARPCMMPPPPLPGFPSFAVAILTLKLACATVAPSLRLDENHE